MSRRKLELGGVKIPLGAKRGVAIEVSESYSGLPVVVSGVVWRAAEPGPTVFVTAAVHGDELNGAGIVRALLLDPPFELDTGTLILVPVVNMLGFDRHQRYLPDRRDLNRSFPGDLSGSSARRFAHAIFQSIVRNSDFGIDLHTAAVRRTNFPNVRADLNDPQVKRLAYAMGSEIIINGKGPKGSLRRAASAAGCPTIIIEAGEVWKIEPTVVEFGVRAIRNALIELGLVKGHRRNPPSQSRVDRATWVRANVGGMLQFHIAPGDVVEKNQVLATSANLLGEDESEILSPADGVVIGMTTLPVVSPGDPVCHVAVPIEGIEPIRAARAAAPKGHLLRRVRKDLATNLEVSDPDS